MWDEETKPLLTPVGTKPILYQGLRGNYGHSQVGGTGKAVVEDTGGEGTARGHWKESIYQDELMTGYLSGSTPMSKLTIHALEDLGYTVDATKADAYTVPASGRRLAGSNNNGRRIKNDLYKGKVIRLNSTPKPGREKEFQEQREKHQRVAPRRAN